MGMRDSKKRSATYWVFMMLVLSCACYRSSDKADGIDEDSSEVSDDRSGEEEECLEPCLGRECGFDAACGVYCGDCGEDSACTEDGRCTRCIQQYCDEVFIPEGPFVMGCDPSPVWGECREFAQPKHVCTLSSYYIDKYEVTIERYMACVEAGTCTYPHVEQREHFEYYFGEEYKHHPVALVTWDEAKTYCEWMGRDLPTEAQWEKAARGGCELVPPEDCGPEDERNYPWGNEEPTCELVLFAENGDLHNPECGGERIYNPDVVDARPLGASPYHVFDMSGNVHEYCSDWMHTDFYSQCVGECRDPMDTESGYGLKVERGGDFATPSPAYLHLANRGGYNYEAQGVSIYLGFRCARVPSTVNPQPYCSAE